MHAKKIARLRRSKRARATIARVGRYRLVVHKSNQHIYANILQTVEKESRTMVSASTVDASLRKSMKGKTKKEKAVLVGEAIAERLLKKGEKQVAFDRSGFRYHGCIKALADAARSHGLVF